MQLWASVRLLRAEGSTLALQSLVLMRVELLAMDIIRVVMGVGAVAADLVVPNIAGGTNAAVIFDLNCVHKCPKAVK